MPPYFFILLSYFLLIFEQSYINNKTIFYLLFVNVSQLNSGEILIFSSLTKSEVYRKSASSLNFTSVIFSMLTPRRSLITLRILFSKRSRHHIGKNKINFS